MQGRQSWLVACVRTECDVIACLEMHRTQVIQLRTHRTQGTQGAQHRTHRPHRTQIQRRVRLNATARYLTPGNFLLMTAKSLR